MSINSIYSTNLLLSLTKVLTLRHRCDQDNHNNCKTSTPPVLPQSEAFADDLDSSPIEAEAMLLSADAGVTPEVNASPSSSSSSSSSSLSGASALPAYPSITPTLTSAPLTILNVPGKGRGVFATRPIAAGEVIEISPVLCISNEEYYGREQGTKQEEESRGKTGEERKGVDGTVLRGYVFTWKGVEGGMALALGIGSLFNHSTSPNVTFTLSFSNYTIEYKTFRPIEVGEELLIFYGHAARFDDDPVADPVTELLEAKAVVDSQHAHTGEDIWGGLDGMSNAEEIGFSSRVESSPKQQRGSRRVLKQAKIRAALLANREAAQDRQLNASYYDEEGSIESESTKIEDLMNASMISDGEVLEPGAYKCYREDDVVPWPQLPWRKVSQLVEESEADISTFDCWIIDMPARSAQVAFDFVKEHSVNFDALSHLKRVRKLTGLADEILSVLLFPVHQAPENIKELVAASPLAAFNTVPYIIPVPAVVARTHAQYLIWTQVWPVAMVVIREGPKAVPITPGWERCKREWIGREIGKVWRAAEAAGRRGEHPIACHVTDTFDVTTHTIDNLPKTLVRACDSRASTGNVLSHAACNVIDAVAVLDRQGMRDPPLHSHLPFPYLLTGLTIFTSHEPCLLCSMSLLHSRISQLYYVKPARGSGGCGSVYGVHEDGGLNHRFEVWEWRGGAGSGAEMSSEYPDSVVGVGLDVLLDP